MFLVLVHGNGNMASLCDWSHVNKVLQKNIIGKVKYDRVKYLKGLLEFVEFESLCDYKANTIKIHNLSFS